MQGESPKEHIISLINANELGKYGKINGFLEH